MSYQHGEGEEELLWAAMLADADVRITKAETELGLLTSGQRRDLLKDQTDWSSDVVADLVRALDEEDAERWRAGIKAVSPAAYRSRQMADEYRKRYYHARHD